MTDVERVLHALLHDIRTPIGVAQGYLRLIQGAHLQDPTERDRAIAKALNALGQAGRLCDSAGEFLDSNESSASVTRVSAASFLNQVEASARNKGWNVTPADVQAHATIAVAGPVAAVCDAIVTVVAPLHASRGSDHASATMHMRADADQLKFAATAGREPELATPVGPFDRWWSRGLPLAVACRRIARSSGHVLTLGAGEALMVAFPLENHPV